MDLKYLSDIHSGRNAQRVQHDVKRSSVGKERHVFNREYSRNNTLVTVTAGHLITNLDLTLLSDVNANGLVDSG